MMNAIEFIRSPNKKFSETVLLIPNFNGSPKNFKDHIQLLTAMGCDVAAINLKHNAVNDLLCLPWNYKNQLGLRHLWADQIEQALTTIGDSVIIFSFSFPSCAALEVLHRKKAEGVKGWICDGGPFLDLRKCIHNFYRVTQDLPTFKRIPLTEASLIWLGSLNYEKDIKAYLTNLPSPFPILSIRTWQDQLVPPDAIDKLFKLQPGLNLQVLSIPQAEHLQGLSKEPEIYKVRVESFLQELSTLSKRDL